MSKLKKILIALAALTMTASAAAAVACSPSYPDYRNPANSTTKPITPPSDEFRGNYTISVKSEGGLQINGVKITAVLDGRAVAQGISINGVIEFDLDPAVYTLRVDESTLPNGYFIPDGKEYKTENDNGEVSVVLSSAIIPTTAVSGTAYSLGDIIYDFSFRDAATSVNHSLSEIFADKKAVVLNFWYTSCNPCRSEFPAMQEAYERYADSVAIIALTNQDTQDEVASFRKQLGLTFYMGLDQVGLHSMFNVQAWPTTVIIDRYGAIALWDSSGAITQVSAWSAMFATYTSDDYAQTNPGNSGNPEEPGELVAPPEDLEMSPAGEILEAISGEANSAKINNYRLSETDKEQGAWPWRLDSDDDGVYLYSTNMGTDFSFSSIYVDINLESGDILSFDYKLNTEVDCDILYVLMIDLNNSDNNSRIAEYSGDTNGWRTENALYVANRPISLTIAFSYLRDQLEGPASGEDFVAIKNLRVIKASDITTATDAATAAVSGNVVNGKYEYYKEVEFNEADGYYYVTNDLGEKALLLADLLETTSWSSLHVGSTSVDTPENTQAKASLYLMSFWLMSNYNAADKSNGLRFAYDTTSDGRISDILINNYYWQSFSDNGYIPVTKDLKEVIDAFTKYYCELHNQPYYEDQWLELCYYINHYGAEHEDGEHCYVDYDPTMGLAKHNALTAYEGTAENPVKNHVNVTKIIMLDAGGGLFYEFVPQHTGVYYIYTEKTLDSVDPFIMVRTAGDKESDRFIAELNDDDSPYKFYDNNFSNVKGYVYLEAGKTYYLQCRFNAVQSTGEYDFYVEYTGMDEYEYLRFCTTGDGMWTYNDKITYYIAIDVALGFDNIYYALNPDGSLGSKVYIDFIHPQYYDNNNHSLLDIINMGYFDFRAIGGANLTDVMLQAYQSSIEGKDESDELYGMAEASYRLVYYIAHYLELMHGEPLQTGYWLAFATYYQHIGA